MCQFEEETVFEVETSFKLKTIKVSFKSSNRAEMDLHHDGKIVTSVMLTVTAAYLLTVAMKLVATTVITLIC